MPFKPEIRKFIVDNFMFGQGGDSLHDDTSFLEGGLIDSTGVLELVAFVSGKFGVFVADEELIPDNFDSVNRLDAYLERKVASAC